MNPAVMMGIMAAISAAGSALTSNKGEQGSTYNKNQLSFLDQMMEDLKGMRGGGGSNIKQDQGYQQGQEWLNSLYNDPEFFKNFEAPLQRQFQEQTVPELANRFASMGSGGSTGSTAFRNQLGREGSNLSTNIAALRGGMQQQGVNQQLQYAQQPILNYMQMMQSALQPTQNTYQPPSAGPFGGMTSAAISGLVQSMMMNNSEQSPSTTNNYNMG